jgi:hypothetical protein
MTDDKLGVASGGAKTRLRKAYVAANLGAPRFSPHRRPPSLICHLSFVIHGLRRDK